MAGCNFGIAFDLGQPFDSPPRRTAGNLGPTCCVEPLLHILRYNVSDRYVEQFSHKVSLCSIRLFGPLLTMVTISVKQKGNYEVLNASPITSHVPHGSAGEQNLWVEWFNDRRLLEPIGNIPPVEIEQTYHDTQRRQVLVIWLIQNGLLRTRGGSHRTRSGRETTSGRPIPHRH